MLDKQHFDKMMRLTSMAHRLNIESQKYSSWEEAHRKLFEVYKELCEGHQVMYLAAVRGELYEGGVGNIVRAFQAGQGDPQKVLDNFNSYLDEITDNAIKGIEKFKQKEELKTTESNKIQSVIEQHQKRQKDSNQQ
jgi:hypothetical protein